MVITLFCTPKNHLKENKTSRQQQETTKMAKADIASRNKHGCLPYADRALKSLRLLIARCIPVRLLISNNKISHTFYHIFLKKVQQFCPI